MGDFEIKRTITEDDIPCKRDHVKSKYEPIVKSVATLEQGEGIEVEVEKNHVVTQVKKLLKSRFPRRRFLISQRSRPEGIYMYIVRKQ